MLLGYCNIYASFKGRNGRFLAPRLAEREAQTPLTGYSQQDVEGSISLQTVCMLVSQAFDCTHILSYVTRTSYKLSMTHETS